MKSSEGENKEVNKKCSKSIDLNQIRFAGIGAHRENCFSFTNQSKNGVLFEVNKLIIHNLLSIKKNNF